MSREPITSLAHNNDIFAATLVTHIDLLHEDTVQLPHPGGEVCLRRLDDEMIVIVHQTICVDEPAETLDGISQNLQEDHPVSILPENLLTRVRTAGYMIQCSFIFDPKLLITIC